MSENTSSIVSKVWSFCNVLRDGGVSYGDYLEQLTYLIFLKMAEEYRKPPYNRDIGIPEEYTWDRLKQQRGAELDIHYKKLLEELGKKAGDARADLPQSPEQGQRSCHAVQGH